MKNILIVVIAFICYSCNSQIVAYSSDANIFIPNSGVYYKDTNLDFNVYEGIWRWENTLTSSEFILQLQKYVNLDSGKGYSYDVLGGEYKYAYNGSELANTLDAFNNSDIVGYQHKINGVTLLNNFNTPQCSSCPTDKKRILLNIVHDNYEGVYGKLVLEHFTENNLEKIRVTVMDGAWLASDQNAPEDIDIPFGQYILTKQ